MTENYLDLPLEDQREILNTVAATSNKFSANILEKDVWICWALDHLFSLKDRKELVFKGGTSLSKVYQLIDRFSEDVDVTIDYRSFSMGEDLFRGELSKTKIKQITETLTTQADVYVKTRLHPFLRDAFSSLLKGGKTGDIRFVGNATLELRYPSAMEADRSGYVSDKVILEFGGRNTTEPKRKMVVAPYLKEFVPSLEYPQAEVDVLVPERTFWEKATLIHVENHRAEFRASKERLARHWYDLALMARSVVGQEALKHRDLLEDVVKHKKVFFRTATANYDACIQGGIKLLPTEENLKVLSEDYDRMREARMFFSEPPTFSEIVEILQELETSINARH